MGLILEDIQNIPINSLVMQILKNLYYLIWLKSSMLLALFSLFIFFSMTGSYFAIYFERP